MQTEENKNIARKPVLVVIYNHHYPDNVAKIEHIYGGRFSRIHHLMPFYEKHRDPNPANRKFNIIPVYDNSHYHQSFIANGFTDYYHQDASHYIFIADDLMLNPQINENNYQKFFNLTPDSAFIEELRNLPNAYSLLPWRPYAFFTINSKLRRLLGPKIDRNPSTIHYLLAALKSHRIYQWLNASAAYNFSFESSGLQYPTQLVNHIEAMQRFKNNNLLTDHIDIKKAVRRHKKGIQVTNHKAINKTMMIRAILEYWLRGKDSYRPYKLAYPLTSSYADIFIMPHNSMNRFVAHCGIFAAYKLFVEIAIPTAIVLTVDNILQATNLKYRMISHYTVPYNEADTLPIDFPIEDKHLNCLESIVKHWPKDYAYIHRLKLSGFKV